MPRTLSKKGSILLARGIDVSLPGEYIEDQSVTDAVNVNLDSGIISKRKGMTAVGETIGGTDLQIMKGIFFRREDVDYNVRVGLDKIEKYNTGTDAWDDISGTTLTGDTTDLISMALPTLSGKRILCITNGIDPIQKWTGSGNTSDLGGTPPRAKFIQEYKTYLVAAHILGGTDIPQRIQWSDTADPENWSTGNAGAIDLIEDGKDITGMNLYGNYLAVHKETSIYLGYLISTTYIFKFDRKNTGVGTVANNSIVNLPTNEQCFVALDGIRAFNGISAPLINAPINDEIRRIINKEFAYRSWGILKKEKDEAWFGIPTGSEEVPQTIYKYNYVKQNIYKDVRSDVTACWVGSADESLTWDQMSGTWDSQDLSWNDTAVAVNADEIYFGNTLGFTYKEDVTSTDDYGNAINAYVDSKDFQAGQEDICRWSELQLWAKGSGTLSVEYSLDEGETWTTVSNSPVTLNAEYPTYDSPIMLYFDIVSSKIRFRFSNNTSTDTFSIKQFTVGYRPVGARR